MLECQVFCKGCKSCFLHCLHHSMPSAREVPRSFLFGDPLAHQVQHTVARTSVIFANLLNQCVIHMQGDAKVAPFCIQFVAESFKNVYRQRRGGQDVVVIVVCSSANCSSITYSPAMSGCVGGGGDTTAPETGTVGNR